MGLIKSRAELLGRTGRAGSLTSSGSNTRTGSSSITTLCPELRNFSEDQAEAYLHPNPFVHPPKNMGWHQHAKLAKHNQPGKENACNISKNLEIFWKKML